jgi:hypothetical protein
MEKQKSIIKHKIFNPHIIIQLFGYNKFLKIKKNYPVFLVNKRDRELGEIMIIV